ncbi:non-specific lipid-transfer protein 1-like [Andrographis paniculata]|uniref:non-specific lipid-transfer protein 1-like n=1 Tax=Andrographis paniculata TaxID=175694 RepID=UPI0021E716E0|nr:non-specific lipid-transfer protein 1-like [Andrographis paniculata]
MMSLPFLVSILHLYKCHTPNQLLLTSSNYSHRCNNKPHQSIPMKGVFLAVLVVFCLTTAPADAVSCGDVQAQLAPCLSYITAGGNPTATCCNGVKTLSGGLRSPQDRQEACRCMKAAAATFNVQPDVASSLASKCGVSVGVSISPNIDCSQIS